MKRDFQLFEEWRRDRNAEAFHELAMRYIAMVYNTCRRILGDSTSAEDVAQECFEALATADLGSRTHIGAWLHRVATNKSITVLRSDARRTRRERAYTETADDNRRSEWNDIYEHVDEAIERLPTKYQIPLCAHYFDQKTHTQVAAELGLARSSVTHRINCGVNEIRKHLKRKGILISAAPLAAALTDQQLHLPASTAFTDRLARIALSGNRFAMPPVMALTAKVAAGAGLVIASFAYLLFVLSVNEATQSVQPSPSETRDGNVRASLDSTPIEPREKHAKLESELRKTSLAGRAASITTWSGGQSLHAAHGRVSGKILDEYGDGVPNALVRIHPRVVQGVPPALGDFLERFKSVYTDKNGAYIADSIRFDGDVVVSATAMNFRDEERFIHLQEGEVRNGIDLTLPPTDDFVGVVVGSDGVPLAKALVVPLNIDANPKLSPWLYWRFTDDDGRFYVGVCAEGGTNHSARDWRNDFADFEIYANGHGSSIFSGVRLALNDLEEFRLEEPVSMVGFVSDAGGRLPFHTVLLAGIYAVQTKEARNISQQFTIRRRVQTTGAGWYRIQGIAPNMKYRGLVSDAKGVTINVAPNVSPVVYPGTVVKYDLDAVHTAEKRVYVTGAIRGAASGKPLPIYGIVHADRAGGTDHRIAFVKDGETTFRLALNEPGSYFLGARYGHALNAVEPMNSAKSIYLYPGENEIDLVLDDPVVIPIRVTDADDAPVESAEVRLGMMTPEYAADWGGKYTSKRTDADGRLTWYAEPNRELWVSATKDGYTVATSEHFVGASGENRPELEFIIRRPADIYGRLLSGEGEALAGRPVKISILDRQRQTLINSFRKLDEFGEFHLEHARVREEIYVSIVDRESTDSPSELLYFTGPADVDLQLGDVVIQ